MQKMFVSVVVCTYNRGCHPFHTIESLLANSYPKFEVILIDQSVSDETEQALKCFQGDERFHYVHSAIPGKGRSCNICLTMAQGEVVAFTDDDCVVPANWLEVMASTFNISPRIGMVFCNVAPGPYNPALGFIPAYERRESKLVRNLWDKCRARGIGAGMAVRRTAALALGCFDENLGPGSIFPSTDEGDLAVRMLLNGWWVYETHRVAVIHHGFRTWEQGKQLSKRDWFATGGAYAKPIKCGYWGFLIVVFYEAVVVALGKPVGLLLRFKRPRGWRQVYHFLHGFITGLRLPIDCRTIRYLSET